MSLLKTGATIAVIGILAGCAQQEEMTMVAPEPTFDKYGNGSCEDGYIYVPGAAPIDQCIPEDECVDPTFANSAAVPCPPPIWRPDDGDDDDGRPAPNRTFTAVN